MAQLAAARRVIVQSFWDWWDDWLGSATLSFVWALGMLTVIFAPPVTFGLYHAANTQVHGNKIGARDLIEGARRYFLQSWLWAILNIASGALVLIALRFYNSGSIPAGFGPVFSSFVIAVLIVWVLVQFYALPFLMEQRDKRLLAGLLLAFRNGLFTALASPIFTLSVFLFGAAVLGISIALVAFLFLGGPPLFAVLGNRAVLDRLATFNVRERDQARYQDTEE